MPLDASNTTGTNFDIKALAALIIELNIARRNFKSYPKGHPLIEASFTKVIKHYEHLLENHDEISIGVAKDTLMLGGSILEKNNLVFRDFAKVLFEHGIGVLTLRKGLMPRELENFNVILGLKREEINRHGGIEAIWEKGRINALAITAIRYDLFSTAVADGQSNGEEPATAEGIWARFTRGLMAGTLGSGAGASEGDFEPEILAALLNEHFGGGSSNGTMDSGSTAAISGFMRQECTRSAAQNPGAIPFAKLAAFISHLNPGLRQQFLSSTFDIRKPDGRLLAESIVEKMPAEVVLETLDNLNRSSVNVPPVIMGLLQKLSLHAQGSSSARTGTAPASLDDLQERMRVVFREHASEEFVPDAYQQQLNTLVSENRIQKLLPGDIADLLATVEGPAVENRISDIVLNLVTSSFDSLEDRELFLQNLTDMFGYFLQIGDYGQLVKMIDRTNDDTFPVDLQYYLRENYARREFLDEIMNGLTTWGKPRYNDIKLLIEKMRSPFIEALLDHLATESNMSLRRFIMDRLIEMGPITRVPVSLRLNDDRWFVLRNLLVILRANSDVSIIPLVRPLAKHAHPKVRYEALNTLVMLHDAASEKQVLRDLDSQDRETLLDAIALAERSRLPDIHKKLLSVLTQGGLTQAEYEIKSAVVKALGELRRSESLTEFARILASSSIFNSKILARLKIDILRALENYPLQTVAPLIERLTDSNDEIAAQARETLKSIKAKSHER